MIRHVLVVTLSFVTRALRILLMASSLDLNVPNAVLKLEAELICLLKKKEHHLNGVSPDEYQI